MICMGLLHPPESKISARSLPWRPDPPHKPSHIAFYNANLQSRAPKMTTRGVCVSR